jgi:enoyl-CoA hydratase
MAYQYLEVRVADGLLDVLINRPEKRNALSQDVLAELGQCFRDAAAREDLSVARIRGAGDRCFAAGGDLDAIRHCPVPVVACLNGDALGGGAELAVACDVRIAAAHARIAFVQGTMCIAPAWGGGSDLVRLVGGAQALRLLCRADFVGAGEAESLGLVQARCGAGDEFGAWSDAWLQPFQARKPHVARAFKALTRAMADGVSPAARRELELANLIETWCHDDHWQAHDQVLKRITS